VDFTNRDAARLHHVHDLPLLKLVDRLSPEDFSATLNELDVPYWNISAIPAWSNLKAFDHAQLRARQKSEDPSRRSQDGDGAAPLAYRSARLFHRQTSTARSFGRVETGEPRPGAAPPLIRRTSAEPRPGPSMLLVRLSGGSAAPGRSPVQTPVAL